MWKFLIFIFLSLESNFAENCRSFVVDDCDRNLCENRAVNNIASPELCQILCTLTVDFTCQSFAYSRAHEVSLINQKLFSCSHFQNQKVLILPFRFVICMPVLCQKFFRIVMKLEVPAHQV